MNEPARTPADNSNPVAAAQWRRLLRALGDVSEHVFNWPHAQSEISRGQAVRHMQRVLYTMFLTAVELDDPGYPTLKRLFDSYWPLGNSNPDCTYFHATVSPQHDYRIFGKRGTSRIVEVQLMDGHFVAGPAHKSMGTLQKIQADANGDIEVILSATPKPGRWMKLSPGVSWLYLRQYYYDWETEIPADLVIERIGATYPAPVITNAELTQRIDRLIDWIPTWYRHLTKRVEGYYEARKDALYFMISTAGMDGLSYGKGWFDIRADQAVIVLRERDNRRRGSNPFRIFDDPRCRALHICDARIRGSQVDSDNFGHNISYLSLCGSCCGPGSASRTHRSSKTGP